MNRAFAASAGLAVLLASGCVTPKVSAPAELPLKKVAVYRNGVGYFERGGKVNAEKLQFKVKPEAIGDFLATLAVMEKGGSSLRAASFPLHLMEPLAPPPPPDPKNPAKKDRLEEVVLELDGKEHNLAVGYVTEQPVWKPSYRLVLDKDGAPSLQVWGIVQNLSGEDWKDVMLSVVAGAPIAFESTLQTPVTPQRPVVSDQGEMISAVPQSQSSYAPPPPPAPEREAEAPAGVDSGLSTPSMPAPMASGPGAMAPRPSTKAASRPRQPTIDVGSSAGAGYQMADSAPRNLSLLAQQQMEGGATRYDLPHPVTIPNDSATMVLLMAQTVKGESVFMYAPEGGVPDSGRHPFRVARFTNTTPGLLERGPIAVYEASSFLGQGVLEPLSSGGDATVPFALERGIAVEVDRKGTMEDARLAHIEHGQLTLERDQVSRTTYKIRNGGKDEAKVVIRHGRQQGWRLRNPPPGTDDQVGKGVALLPVKVKSYGTAEVIADERLGHPMGADWLSPEADQAVKAYLADPRADPKIAAVLRKAWEIRDTLVKAMQERQKLQGEQGILQNASDQTRQSFKALQRNNSGVDDLRKQLSDRLIELDSKLAAVNKRLVELELEINEQSVRFTEMLRDLFLEKALPPV